MRLLETVAEQQILVHCGIFPRERRIPLQYHYQVAGSALSP
jgi:hypothetical protein